MTPLQNKVLEFIASEISACGLAPTFEAIQQHAELASKSQVSRILLSLERHGFIRRRSHLARAIEIIRLPPDIAAKYAGIISIAELDRQRMARALLHIAFCYDAGPSEIAYRALGGVFENNRRTTSQDELRRKWEIENG